MRDAQENKTMAILSYLYILFVIPLLTGAYKTSPFLKFHVNQGAVLGLIGVGYSILSMILSSVIKVRDVYWGAYVSYTPAWLTGILWLLGIPIAILTVMGIINAVNGRMQPLPVIGGVTIIK